MLPPLLKIALDEPSLLFSHAAAYIGLASVEIQDWEARLRQRLVLLLLLSGALLMTLILGGVSLMLYATSSAGHWLLWAVPLAPLLVTLLVAALLVRKPGMAAPLSRVRAQLEKDMHCYQHTRENPP